MALSDHAGVAQLVTPAAFGRNRGLSFLADGSRDDQQLEHHEVPLAVLDEAVGEAESVGLMKIDVEGHELEVLKGAACLLGSGRIRDILFEEHRSFPTPVTALLESNGYTIYRVDGKLSGPILTSRAGNGRPRVFEPFNFLATRDPERSLSRLSRRGWVVFD